MATPQGGRMRVPISKHFVRADKQANSSNRYNYFCKYCGKVWILLEPS